MEEQPIESENVEVVETAGGDDRGKRLQAVYSMLDSDEAYRPYVPATYDEFLGKIAKDRNYAQAIHKMVASDEVYSQYLPETFEETVSYFGLGKPSPTPQSGSGLGSTQSGGQMPMAQQPRSGASPSSAPVYLSPEELGAEAQMPAEEIIQTQTVQTEAPTPQEIEPFKDPKVQDALRLEYLKKKAQKSKTESEAYKGTLLGGLYNSAIEGTGKMLEGGAYMLGVMFGGDSEQFSDETEDERIEAFTKKIEEVGIKKTIDELKSKGTTQEFIDKAKEEGGIIAQGVFGLAESAPAMLTPMQVGFLFSTFETAHKEIRKEMPGASPAAQFLYAATQGTVAMLLEKAGVSNLIQNKSVMKNLTGKIVNEIQQMGVKMTPEVVESTAAKLVNGFLAEAETGGLQYVSEESIKQIADALEGEKDVFKFEGWQQFLSNTVDAAAAEGIGGFVMKSLGEAASAIKSPADKQKVEQDKQQVVDMMNDLSNPNVSPEAKQAISKKVDEKAEAILETYASEQNKIQGLSEEGKKEFTFLSDQATSMEAVLADPNVSDATKQAVQADLEETNKKIETILSSAKETFEQQEFNNLSDTDQANIRATQNNIETYKKILAIPGASKSSKDDAQKNIDEANKKIESILASAKEAPTTQQPTEAAQPKVTVEEIKSLPLTRIEGAGMGSNQAVGTFISTEPENRYAKQFPNAEVQSMEVEIENPYVSEDTNMIDFRNELINRRKSELDETDFTEVEIPEGNFTIDDLSDSGIEKVAGMVTEELKAQGYDSIYFPAIKSNGETQEGELVVFDREKVKRKDTPQTTQQDATQSGKIEQSNIGERPIAAEQQQGEQANRTNQEADVAPSQAETSGGDSVAEGGKKKEVAIEDIDDAAVDKTNQTIIAYHATPTGKVSTGKEAGIHIGTKKAAEQVKAGRNQGKGTVEKVKTTIKRPLVLSDMPSWSSANLLSQLYNPATGQYFGLTRNDVRDIRDSDMTEKQKQQSIIDFLKKKGYDAIAYKNDSEDAGSYSYVLFEEPTIEGGSTVSEGTGQPQSATQQEVNQVAQKSQIAPKNFRDLFKVNRELFGLDRVKSLASSIAMDRMIGAMAKRAGISKSEMYGRLKFEKATEQDLPQGVKMQVDAWHGSPYQFDKFTTEKIGTGEGVQAFGWGLYFTDLEGIARNYAKKLSKANTSKFDFEGKDVPSVINTILQYLERSGFDINTDNVKDVLTSYINEEIEEEPDNLEELQNALDFVNNTNITKAKNNRNLYKVSLQKGKNPDQYTWLEWDKELSIDQIKNIIENDIDGVVSEALTNYYTENNDIATTKELIDTMYNKGVTGKRLYEILKENVGDNPSPKDASIALLNVGIDGIKYPAESVSRGATSDNARGFNYVVFDENAVSIEDVIKFQKDANKARGAAMVGMDGQAVVYALSDPNVSTPLHEMAHVFEHYLTDAERESVQDFAGTKEWTVETSEKFARGFEKYLSDGKAPNTVLEKIFSKFKEWLTDIYNGIVGSEIDIELNDAMREIYSQMLGENIENKNKKITPEQQQRINTRSLLSEISDWNKLGSKAKRSPEGVTEMQRLQKAGKELGLTVDTKAIKSGLRLVATNADGQVMTVEKVNKVMNPKRVVWSDANYAVQETTDANGNRVIEFYDAKTGDQIRSNSKEGAKAKEAYYEGNIQKFLGKDKPIDVDALLDFYDGDEESFNKAVLEAVAESDNAFEIAANYKNFVKHDDALTTTMYDPTFELAQLVGQMSEEDFKENFDKNFLNKNSKWIDPNYRGEPLDSRISAWVDLDNEKSDSPFAASLRGRDASSILRDITDLVQGYPDGPQSVRQSKEGELLPFASQRFRQITGKPLNPVTAYEFNEMFNRYAENQAFGFASKVAWEDLTPQQKQEIIDEQTRPVEDEFFFEGTDFENQPELFAENEQDQGGAEEFPTEEQRDEIEEDGFAMPTDEEMAAKSEEIQTDLQKAIQDVKDKFGDLFNQNLGIAYDPKVEARKLYNFHVALVNLAKTAIRSGITTAADFAKTLGKRLDKFTERAFNDAMNDLNGDPMIINSEQDMLNAEYQRVAESYAKQREDAKKLKKPFLKRFIEGINAGWFDANYVSKKLLGDVGGYEAIKAKNLLGGASAKAKMQYDTFKREIFGGLNSAEKKLLNDIIQARTIISIDNRYDAKGKQRIKHPGDTNKESQAIFLGQIEESQPELFKKLNDRAEKYFNAQRELLDERLKEGRISIEQYQGMIDNDYSPRVFLEYLIDDAESGSGLTSGGQGSVGRSDIKSLSDGDVNSLFHNAEWLLASNVLATSRSIFHNRANRSLYELAKANPNNGFIEIQNPNGFNKETGQPTYKDPRSDQRQIQFFENGVRKSMLVTREFGESWNNNNPLLSPQYANAIRIASGGVYKRLFATGINPLFALSNLPRDIAHSLFFTNAYSPTFPVALAQISTDLVRTAKDAWKFNRSKDKNGRYYKYTMQGGGMDFLATQGLPFEQQALIQSTAKDAMDATVKVLGYINNSSEIWVRLAIREREANKLTAKFARDNGRMPNAAEKESIETSATEVARSQMDFSQGGRWAKAMDNLIPYLNASLQGLRVSARYARENPKVFSYKVAQALAVSAAIAAYNMRFKDDYDDLEDEEKNRNIIIMLDFYKTVDGKKRRAYIRIPKNQSSQWIFAMGEIMGESMAAKEFRPRKGASTLQTLMPPYDPRNIPVIDALNTYETGYDRFREKYVYDKDYRGEPWAEYYENKTPWLWRDIGEQFNISPIRLKAAVGKLTADPDNNMIWVAVTEGYDKLIKSVPEDEQKSINDMAVESMEQMLTPVQRKFLAFTNPDSKAKSIRELEASQATKIKLQNDTVKNYVKKYINDEMTETEARSAFNEWLNTQSKDSVNTKRLKTRFENSIQFKDVDNVFYRMSETKYPEVKARLLFDAYLNAPDDDAREVLLFQAKNNPNVPKDKSSSFWKEFNRLKALGEE